MILYFTFVLALYLHISNGSAAEPKSSRPREKADIRDDLWFHFMTRPDIQAPKFNVTIFDEKALSPGYWFVSPYEDATKFVRGMPWVGPYIYDNYGDLLWAGTPLMDHFKLWDFKVAKFDGIDMLTGISHRDNGGLILNHNYEVVKSVSWTKTWLTSNMHEFNVVADGSRALVATKAEHKKLSLEVSKTVGFDGKCEVTVDGIKELNITGDHARTLFEWHAIDHIPLSESMMRPNEVDKLCSRNLDLNHINSIDKFPDGDYLISSRHVSTIYKISHTDGSILWRLGGLKSDFSIPAEVRFSRQHNARFHEQNASHTIISLFDNAWGWEGPTHDSSRGLIVVLDTREMKAELVLKVERPIAGITESRGNNQLLPSGSLFVCWVDSTLLSEHDTDGRLLMTAKLKPDIDTYRAYKFPWVGKPTYPPNVYSAAFVTGEKSTEKSATRSTTIIYVSWNGATEVRKWKFYESDMNGGNLKHIKSKNRKGFETSIRHDEYARYVVVEALDREDHSIGRSNVIQTVPPVEASYGDGGFWTVSVLTSPFGIFVSGFLAASFISAVIFLVFGSSLRWKARRPAYEPAEHEEREVLFQEGEEAYDDEGIELKPK